MTFTIPHMQSSWMIALVVVVVLVLLAMKFLRLVVALVVVGAVVFAVLHMPIGTHPTRSAAHRSVR